MEKKIGSRTKWYCKVNILSLIGSAKAHCVVLIYEPGRYAAVLRGTQREKQRQRLSGAAAATNKITGDHSLVMNIIALSKRLYSPPFSGYRSLHGGINDALSKTVFSGPIMGRSVHHLRKAGRFVIPRVLFVSRNLSTNVSSSKQPAFLRWYLKKVESHPFITKSVTTSLIYMAADLTSQVRDT